MPQLRRTEMQLQQQQQLQSNQVDAPGDTGARDQDSDKPQTAQASLITLQQRMQVTSGAVRANPFLAFRDAPKSPTSDATPSIQKEKSQSVWLPDAMQSFAPKADADNTEGAAVHHSPPIIVHHFETKDYCRLSLWLHLLSTQSHNFVASYFY